MKEKIVLVALVSAICFAAQTSFGREHWPVADEQTVDRQKAWDLYQQEVISNDTPEIADWSKKGKPFIPWASKPGDLPQAQVPAFPGAEGGGMYSFGGRGGKVYVVTNLDDSGPGTLREACEAAGPRIVVFNVAGIIHLQKPIFIEAPYITIAGQTSPGDGICIADEGINDDAHDVVIRYVRFRRGNPDIFNRHGSHYGNPIGNIIIDHCSASWGEDQNMDTYRHMYEPTNGGPALKLPSVNVTIQWCISSEALNTYNHAFGGDWGGRNSLFDHNLFACNTGRNPSIAMTYDFNFVNNVLFNWRHRSVDGGDKNSSIDMINNYYKPGPATLNNPVRYRILEPAASWSKADPIYRFGKAFVEGNYVVGYTNVSEDNWDGGVQFQEDNGLVEKPDALKALIAQVRVDKPFPMPPVTIQSAQDAYESVLDGAGATLPRRDSVDQRVIEEVRTGKVWSEDNEFTPPHIKDLPANDVGTAGNGIITDISQVGGYPDYKGEPIKDLCPDGIPLSWKMKYHLDSNDASLAQEDLQGDRYTVMDKYLDGLDPTKKIDWKDPRSRVNTLQ